jgi:hypothetical protein
MKISKKRTFFLIPMCYTIEKDDVYICVYNIESDYESIFHRLLVQHIFNLFIYRLY